MVLGLDDIGLEEIGLEEIGLDDVGLEDIGLDNVGRILGVGLDNVGRILGVVARRQGSRRWPHRTLADGINDQQDHTQRTGADAYPGNHLVVGDDGSHQSDQAHHREDQRNKQHRLASHALGWCRTDAINSIPHQLHSGDTTPTGTARTRRHRHRPAPPNRAGPTPRAVIRGRSSGGCGTRARRCAAARAGPPARNAAG